MVIVWAVFATPLVEIASLFQEFETSGQFNYDATIDSWVRGWFNMILFAIFGIMCWGTWRVLRKELTRSQL